MNRIFIAKTGIVVLFVMILSLIGLKIYNRKDITKPPTVFPKLCFTTINGDSFKTDTVKTKVLIIVFYSPGCTFCEHEGVDLSRNSKSFKDVKIMFVTSESIDSARAYSLRSGIDTILNFYSLIDTSYKVLQTFGIRTIPTTLIYGSDRQLVKIIEGEVSAKKLLKIICNNE